MNNEVEMPVGKSNVRMWSSHCGGYCQALGADVAALAHVVHYSSGGTRMLIKVWKLSLA